MDFIKTIFEEIKKLEEKSHIYDAILIPSPEVQEQVLNGEIDTYINLSLIFKRNSQSIFKEYRIYKSDDDCFQNYNIMSTFGQIHFDILFYNL